MNAERTGGADGGGATPGRPGGPVGTTPLRARSFVVRALFEEETPGRARWHGFVTDVQTGTRQAWHRPSDVAAFMERRLPSVPPSVGVEIREAAVVGPPPLTDVVSGMLAILGSRLVPVVAVPAPNVTLERVTERLVGLGNQRGAEPTGSLGTRTLRGGRLDARVRFQLWGATAGAVDDAVLALHSDVLDDREELRHEGFLKLAAAETTLAELVDNLSAWRKTTSYDVLYEYQYVDGDDADSLIARIPVTTDPERRGSPDREIQTVTDEIVRWDDETAPPLVVGGPVPVSRISALVFEPGPALGGTVTVLRSVAGSPGPVAHLPDLDAFLAAVSGDAPAQTAADVVLTPADFLTQLGAVAGGLELGDWDTDGVLDQYAGFDRRLSQPVRLPSWLDRLTVTYTPPAGPATGLDQTAVAYLRINAP